MRAIPEAYREVPMIFRAQVSGRSQLHFLDRKKKDAGEKQDVQLWAEQWIDKAEFISREKAQDIQTATYGAKSYQMAWRFVTNGGQDDGMIRPVIGARGIPFYPGSSMKGAFRQTCERAEQSRELQFGSCSEYCGDDSEITPGILRFLGAYPVNDWTENLVDLVHPQQGWQVKTQETNAKPKGESAYALASLYKPTLRFEISSTKPLASEQWAEIWRVWEQALAAGLGSRVSAGYGQIEAAPSQVLYRVHLKGQGQAAKLIDGTGEFRPNIFRAALRGHALRIFGGLTNADIAEQLVEQLFGGVHGKGTIGLLRLDFQVHHLELKPFGQDAYEQSAYDVEGEVIWSLTRPLTDTRQTEILQNLIKDLMWFAMVLAGFGKSWRRADHRLFYTHENEDYEKLIGCHWQWSGEIDRKSALRVWKPSKIGGFIDSVLETAKYWMQSQGVVPDPNNHPDWREAWHPAHVKIWGRIAKTKEECEAIIWLHKPYQQKIFRTDKEKTIKASSVTGQVGQIGRLWHRMYSPTVLLSRTSSTEKMKVKPTRRYLELLTIFPDDSKESVDFLEFLNTNPYGFEQLWGDQ